MILLFISVVIEAFEGKMLKSSTPRPKFCAALSSDLLTREIAQERHFLKQRSRSCSCLPQRYTIHSVVFYIMHL